MMFRSKICDFEGCKEKCDNVRRRFKVVLLVQNKSRTIPQPLDVSFHYVELMHASNLSIDLIFYQDKYIRSEFNQVDNISLLFFSLAFSF